MPSFAIFRVMALLADASVISLVTLAHGAMTAGRTTPSLLASATTHSSLARLTRTLFT